MSTVFPTALDDFSDANPSATLAVNGHSSMHANLNDAVEALEAKVGVSNSQVVGSIEYRLNTVTGQIYDAVVAHSSSANPHSQYPTVERMAVVEAFNNSLSSAFDLSTTTVFTSQTTQLAATSTSAHARDITFCGWGERYSLPGVSFNGIKIKAISRTATTLASKWMMNSIRYLLRQ